MRRYVLAAFLILAVWSSVGVGVDPAGSNTGTGKTTPSQSTPKSADPDSTPKSPSKQTGPPKVSKEKETTTSPSKPTGDAPKSAPTPQSKPIDSTPKQEQAAPPSKPAPASVPKPPPPEPTRVADSTPKPTPAPSPAVDSAAPKPTPAPKPVDTVPVVTAPKKVVEKFKLEAKVKAAVVHLDTKSGDWKDLIQGQKLSTPLQQQDVQERLHVKISSSRKLHQVFVLLRNKATDEEVGFIGQVESGSTSDYIVDVDIASSGFEAGTYEIILYLGDFLIENSLEWILGDLNFKIAGGEYQAKPRPVANPLYTISYDEKPEIKHQFRQPEPRPPKFVSDTFTFLCLFPLLILFVLWFKIGVNVSNFPFTLSALGFHIGLAALFGVYALFWIKLTMFEALRWMGPPGIVTFVAGNRLLNYIAERRTKSA